MDACLFCQKNTTSNSSMQLCSFPNWAFILTVLDCCLELGAIPVSCSECGCASRPVCDYIRSLGVVFDDQLTLKEHIAKTARSCRFALHNIRKIRPFLMEHAAQLLVQALVISRLDYCNALLARLPSNTIKPLQMIQNAVAQLVLVLHLSLSPYTGYRLQLPSSLKH